MNDSDEVDESGQQFLIRLHEQTGGDGAAQVSMYEIGELLGMERTTAARTAEALIGLELVEIRTLSGAVAISAEGTRLVQSLVGAPAADNDDGAPLGNDPILDEAGRRSVQQLAAELKNSVGTLGLNFDDLSELMADLKTLDAQLESPRPKTAIVRECLQSIQAALGALDAGAVSGRLRSLLNPST